MGVIDIWPNDVFTAFVLNVIKRRVVAPKNASFGKSCLFNFHLGHLTVNEPVRRFRRRQFLRRVDVHRSGDAWVSVNDVGDG